MILIGFEIGFGYYWSKIELFTTVKKLHHWERSVLRFAVSLALAATLKAFLIYSYGFLLSLVVTESNAL